MKLRVKGNSLRLRLTQSEITQLAQDGQVSEQLSFGINVLTYTLLTSEKDHIHAVYSDNAIQVHIPTSTANDLANTDQVGIETYQDLPDGQQLYILIEKDFKCLIDRPHEDESDNFPNPIEQGN